MDLATDTGDKIVHRLLITTMHERTRPKKDKPNNNSLEHDATATISARARSRIGSSCKIETNDTALLSHYARG